MTTWGWRTMCVQKTRWGRYQRLVHSFGHWARNRSIEVDSGRQVYHIYDCRSV